MPPLRTGRVRAEHRVPVRVTGQDACTTILLAEAATEMARQLHDALATLTDWAQGHRADIATARTAYDRRPDDPAA